MSGDLARRITTAVHEAAQIGTGAAIATAIHSVRPDDLAEFFHASLDEDIDADPITTGLPASPGAAAGRIVLTAEAAMEAGDRGEAVILVRPETTPDDVHGMQASRGHPHRPRRHGQPRRGASPVAGESRPSSVPA